MRRALLALILSIPVLVVVVANASLAAQSKTVLSYGSIDSVWRKVVALDGSGDFSDIQSAVDSVPSSSRGVIIIKEGIYDLNLGMKFPFKSIAVRSNLTIVGSGIDRTVIRSFPEKQTFGSSIRAMSVTSTGDIANFVIENLTVVQNGTPDNMGFGAIDLRGGTNTNVTIRNVKVTDVTGAAIELPRFGNVTIEGCTIERAWTGIALDGGTSGVVRENRVFDVIGDGIFPQPQGDWNLSVTDLTIENNYIENAGDTGIDVTSISQIPPHENIRINHNTLNNSDIRICYAIHVNVTDNVLVNGLISVDNGQGMPVDVVVQGNRINTSAYVGIGFYGAENCSAINNQMYLSTPAGSAVQVGISAGIWGNGLIEGNLIVGSKDYGINFAGWGCGGESTITIRNNTILDFNSTGIYDDAVSDGPVLIENNTIWDRRTPFISHYGIRTDYSGNVWTIRYNQIYAGTLSYISASNSYVYGNVYAPP